MPTEVAPVMQPDYAMLVQGVDEYDFWLRDEQPRASLNDDAISFHKKSTDKRMSVLGGRMA